MSLLGSVRDGKDEFLLWETSHQDLLIYDEHQTAWFDLADLAPMLDRKDLPVYDILSWHEALFLANTHLHPPSH